jgi:hypothetical protein
MLTAIDTRSPLESVPASNRNPSPPTSSRGLKARLHLAAFSDGELIVGASLADDVISVHFSGSADLSAKAKLDAFFAHLHAEALRLGIHQAVIDIRKLEFMSSSGLKAITTWLLAIDEMKPAQRYRVVFLSSGSHWQSRSMQALKYFAPGVVRIDSGMPPPPSSPGSAPSVASSPGSATSSPTPLPPRSEVQPIAKPTSRR